MKKIKLTQGKFALVDDSDFKYFNQRKWNLGSTGYARTTFYLKGCKLISIKMHQLIIGSYADHINGNKLDNRRENLRLATKSQNAMNKKKRYNSNSDYKGVSKKRKGWIAVITKNKKRFRIGSFKNEHHAALAYDLWAKDLFGEYAKLNFKYIIQI